MPTIKKVITLIFISILLLVYPAIHLFDSIRYLNNAVEAEAKIVSYVPKMDAKAGGMMEVSDYYRASFDGYEEDFLLGIRTVKMKNMKEEMAKELPFSEEDTFKVLYEPGHLESRMVKPESRMLLHVYNSDPNIALLYLMKLGSTSLLLWSLTILVRGKREAHLN